MSYRQLVEIGKIALIKYGNHAGKLCAIVDVIDQNRVLIEGPVTNINRQGISLRKLRLTKLKLKMHHSAGTKVVRTRWNEDNITEKWSKTSIAKKIAADKLRSKMTDFDRFKVYRAKQAMNRIIAKEMVSIRRKAKYAKRLADGKPPPKKRVRKGMPKRKAKPSKEGKTSAKKA